MRLLFGLILLALATTAQAQIQLGVRGGTTINNISQTETLDAVSPDFDELVGFTAAAYLNVPIGAQFAFQPELAYTQKGFSLSQGADIELFGAPLPVGVVARSRFDYLEAPLLFQATLGDQQLQAYVQAGPALGYALGGRLKTQATGLLDIDLTNTEIDLDAINYERFEVSGIVGAGLKYRTGFGAVSLDGRYQQGFTELYDIPLVSERVRNRGFAVNLGVSFFLD